ncbi:hypothetical protein GCM10010507_19580 [Streptomyces cinnamoneus]|uniref:Uncharacterized protein n=1 Tax=Streptomyces cinnamoneus TaxID=53446 RepID=A0A918TFW7_STRCJ|nr:hypothetical protein GCM10010507_19580 [Streptomyces cinnamoneus]
MSRDEVDALRVDLEVDEEPGLLRQADAGEVPQPPLGGVLLALDAGDTVPDVEQHLVGRLGRLVLRGPPAELILKKGMPTLRANRAQRGCGACGHRGPSMERGSR